jgi:radical SAM protein with 4Fe4S-binding SPASM domain
VSELLSPKPGVCELEITRRCQNDCFYCFVFGRKDAYGRKAEMTLENFKRIVDDLADNVAETDFGLMGGEPTLHRDLIQMLRYVRENTGYVIHFPTNGRRFSNAEFTSRFLDRAEVDGIQVSVLSHLPEIHDRMVGSAGAWRETIEGIRNLLAEGQRISTNTTLTRLNASSFLETMEFLADLGIGFISFNLGTPMSREVIQTGHILGEREFAGIVLGAQEKAEELGVSINTLHSYNYCVLNPEPYGLRHYPCSLGSCMLYIDVGYNLLACYYYNKVIGNVLKEGIARLWHSERYNYYRRREHLPGKCKGCAALNACGGPCILRYPMEKDALSPMAEFY